MFFWSLKGVAEEKYCLCQVKPMYFASLVFVMRCEEYWSLSGIVWALFVWVWKRSMIPHRSRAGSSLKDKVYLCFWFCRHSINVAGLGTQKKQPTMGLCALAMIYVNVGIGAVVCECIFFCREGVTSPLIWSSLKDKVYLCFLVLSLNWTLKKSTCNGVVGRHWHPCMSMFVSDFGVCEWILFARGVKGALLLESGVLSGHPRIWKLGV